MKTCCIKIIPIIYCAVLLSCQNKLNEIFKEPDVSKVKNVLNTSLPLAYASNLAIAALNGEKLSNVSFVKGGSSALGNFLIAITIDDKYPLPQNVQADGKILVAGVSVRDREYMMSVIFTQLNIQKGIFKINDISTFPVVIDSNIVTGKKTVNVVYADMDINVGSDTLQSVNISSSQTLNESRRYQNMEKFDGKAIVEQNTWIIQIDNNQTPEDCTDDIYTISGGGQYLEAGDNSGSISQMIMYNISMKPTCKLNPFDGWTLIQNLDAGSSKNELGQVILNSHSACDGKMDITAATGVYVRYWGKTIDLGLGQ